MHGLVRRVNYKPCRFLLQLVFVPINFHINKINFMAYYKIFRDFLRFFTKHNCHVTFFAFFQKTLLNSFPHIFVVNVVVVDVIVVVVVATKNHFSQKPLINLIQINFPKRRCIRTLEKLIRQLKFFFSFSNLNLFVKNTDS